MSNNMYKIVGVFFTVFAVYGQNKPKHYIMLFNGETSFSYATNLLLQIDKNSIRVLPPDGQKADADNLVLTRQNEEYISKSITNQFGTMFIKGKLKNESFIGAFTLKVSDYAKKQLYYTDDKGVFEFIPFSEKKFKQLKKEINDRLYNVKKYKSLEVMAKVSPYARKLLARQKKAKSLPKKTFYVRVVDQYNDPVVGAKVKIEVEDTTAIVLTYTDWPSKTYFRTTDQNGCFFLNNMKMGYRPSILSVEKDGYTNIKHHYDVMSLWKDKYTIPTEPLIVKVRKKGANPTYLIQNEDFDMKIKANAEQFYSFIDLEQTWEDAGDHRDYMKDFLPKHYDMKISTTTNKSKSKWKMIFTTSAINGGFILSHDFLSVAPQDGYKKEIKVQSIPEGEKVNTRKGIINLEKLEGEFLYVKSRNPAIYTRMKIGDAYVSSHGLVIIRASAATNPYVKRNLEYNDKLPYQIAGKCKQDVLETFLKGKLPEKPNIKKMMNEFKKTHKRVKNKYGRYQWMKK